MNDAEYCKRHDIPVIPRTDEELVADHVAESEAIYGIVYRFIRGDLLLIDLETELLDLRDRAEEHFCVLVPREARKRRHEALGASNGKPE